MRASSGTVVGALVLGAAGLLAFGCTSAAAKLQAWEGRPVSEMVAALGKPDRIVSYPFGGRVYVWEEERATAVAADASGRRQAVGQNRATQVYREMALVGDDGVVLRTHAESAAKGSAPSTF
jgi:hypothetical protein